MGKMVVFVEKRKPKNKKNSKKFSKNEDKNSEEMSQMEEKGIITAIIIYYLGSLGGRTIGCGNAPQMTE
jgi:hypothetical protein